MFSPVQGLCAYALPPLWDSLTDLTVKFNAFAVHHCFAELFHDWMLDPALRYNVTLLVKSSWSNFSHAKQKKTCFRLWLRSWVFAQTGNISCVRAEIHSVSLLLTSATLIMHGCVETQRHRCSGVEIWPILPSVCWSLKNSFPKVWHSLRKRVI